MKEAPVLIFIVNPLAVAISKSLTTDERVSEICNTFFLRTGSFVTGWIQTVNCMQRWHWGMRTKRRLQDPAKRWKMW